MKVAHFAEYASGGVATYIKNIVDSQIENVNISEITIFCSKRNTDFDTLKFQSKKVKIIPYSYKRGIKGIFKILSMKKIIMVTEPDVIHIHSTFAGLIRFSFMFSRSKKKILYCAHGWAFNKKESRLNLMIYKVIEKILSNFCYKIINISSYDSKEAAFIDQSKMVTIRNSIPDLSIKKSIKVNKDNQKKILFVGRLDFQKGIDILIQVMNKYFKDENIRLTVVGDTLLGDSAGIKAKNTFNIKFVGWKSQRDVLQLLNDTDALIMPSRWEGLPITALEAMRSSKMILASDADGIPELVINHYNGILFSKDSEHELRKAINEFLKMSHESIQELGKNSRYEYLTNFNYNEMINRLNRLYLEVTKV